MRSRKHILVFVTMASCGPALSGCGILSEAAVQSGESSLRTLIDLFFTEITNEFADALLGSFDDGGPADGNGDAGGDGGDGDMNGDDPVTRGQNLLADNCAGCHGADGASGFAPNIQGADALLIDDNISGNTGHLMINLSAADVDDLVAYLASL